MINSHNYLLTIPGDTEKTIAFAVQNFLEIARESIQNHGFFSVALSGGSTPKAIFHELAKPVNSQQIDWSKVLVFWSDERSAPPNDPESNYYSALQSGFSLLPIPKDQIFRMKAEDLIEMHALDYEKLIYEKIPGGSFDLIMLGMGDDGHTASLFPQTHALITNEDHLVTSYYVPQKFTWRMTMTYGCINRAKHIVIYVLGKGKQDILKKVFLETFDPTTYPVQKIGTANRPALWIIDQDAAKLLNL